MTPHDIISTVLERVMDLHDADEMAHEILQRLASHALVVVHADRVVQQEGKVCVTRALVESVLEDAKILIDAEYATNGKIHPALRWKYDRDMADILALRAELPEQTR